MAWGDRVTTGVGILLALAVLALVLGQVLGQPVLLSYVTTGSMEPTIDTGDGFVAVPVELAGPIEEGDVVVFEAETLHGGGLTTHRIVGETDRGYITRGDANPFTDQDNEEPPVKDEQIVAVAGQFNGHLIVIPHLGSIVEGMNGVLTAIQTKLATLLGTRSMLGTQGLAYLIFSVTAVLYVVDMYLSSDKERERTRDRDTGINTRVVVGLMALVLVCGATIPMVVPAGTESIQIISSDFDSERPNVIQKGTSTSISYPIANGGKIPMYVYFEDGENIRVNDSTYRLSGGSVRNNSLAITAPPETGTYRYFITEYRYLAILPQSHTYALYQIHPWLPIAVIDALIGIPFYLLGIKLVGTGRIRERSRDSPGSMNRLRSWIE